MERWRAVSGYEGLYDVSDQGNVRSWRAWRDRKPGDLLRPGISSGKRTVVLYRDGKGITRLIAHLVLEEFTGPRPPGQEARHGPGGALDDRHVNLCWGTPKENQGPDRVRDGTSNRGTRQWQAKLTAEIVTECRSRCAAGERIRVLAAEFGVSVAGMSNAVSGDTWAWLPGAVPVDKKRHGRPGTAHHSAKLTPELIEQARQRYAAGESQVSIARSLGVAQPTLGNALSGRTWKSG